MKMKINCGCKLNKKYDLCSRIQITQIYWNRLKKMGQNLVGIIHKLASRLEKIGINYKFEKSLMRWAQKSMLQLIIMGNHKFVENIFHYTNNFPNI